VRTTASTWGASFIRARLVYSAVVRSAMGYRAAIWHSPTKPNGKPQGLAAKLQPLQNKCLRVVAGAYKATPTRNLEVETYTPPIDLYLDSRLAAFQSRLAHTEADKIIQKACSAIWSRIKGRRRKHKATPIAQNRQQEWARKREEHFLALGKTREQQRVLVA